MLSVKLKSRFERKDKVDRCCRQETIGELSHEQAVSGGIFLTIGTVKQACSAHEDRKSKPPEKVFIIM